MYYNVVLYSSIQHSDLLFIDYTPVKVIIKCWLYSLHCALYLLLLLFHRWVVSDTLGPRGLQHTRLLCPLLTPRICSNSCPLSQWCYLTVSSSAAPFSFCFQSFQASESFPMSHFFELGGQSTGVSASAPFPPKNTQGWSPLEWTGWISLQSKGLSRVFSNTTVQKHQFFGIQLSSQSNSHIYTWPQEKP